MINYLYRLNTKANINVQLLIMILKLHLLDPVINTGKQKK